MLHPNNFTDIGSAPPLGLRTRTSEEHASPLSDLFRVHSDLPYHTPNLVQPHKQNLASFGGLLILHSQTPSDPCMLNTLRDLCLRLLVLLVPTLLPPSRLLSPQEACPGSGDRNSCRVLREGDSISDSSRRSCTWPRQEEPILCCRLGWSRLQYPECPRIREGLLSPDSPPVRMTCAPVLGVVGAVCRQGQKQLRAHEQSWVDLVCSCYEVESAAGSFQT
ncbi:hypothetical protein BJ546DRAFT_591328 [Cryomyces antarcticus]